MDADRRAHKVAYARVLREAKRDAMGALEDLAFLAQHLKPDWVYDVVTETRPLHPPTEDEVPSEEARQLMGLMGRRPYAPMEDFLRSVLRKVAWEKWPDEEDAHRPRKGAFVVVRLAAAMEEGLNPEDGHPTHVVQVVTRQDPAGQIKVWGYPEPRRPGDDKMGGIPRSPFG